MEDTYEVLQTHLEITNNNSLNFKRKTYNIFIENNKNNTTLSSIIILLQFSFNMSKESNKKDKSDLSYIKDYKTLEKIEKYVDKNREKTSQGIIEKKSKRPTKNFQEWDLEVMISRISIESKPKEKNNKISKSILYAIYIIFIIIIVTIVIKSFFIWNFMSQIS